MTKKFLVLCASLLGMLQLIAPVAAHGYLLRAIPEDRAVLERAPTRLQYWFSEGLEPRFSSLNLRDSNGTIVASGAVDTRNSNMLTMQLPPGSLPDGAYIVELRPAFGDAHVVAESRVFFVGEEIGGVTGTAAATTAQPLEVVWKASLTGATFLLFGVYALYAFVLVPAWGSRDYPIGGLPPRVMRRLNQLVYIGIAWALVGQGLALLQQTMTFFNVDAAQALNPDFWQIVRLGSRFGDVWNIRLLLLGLLVVLHFGSQHYASETPFAVRASWTANVWLMALMIGAQAIISHASGALTLPWIALLMHWLHSVSVAFWIGGMVVLVIVLPVALQPYADTQRRAALLVVMGRFSWLIQGALLLVITTGIYSATNWFYSPADVATNYGATLGLKLLMTALLLAFGTGHYLALHPAQAAQLEQRFGGLLRAGQAFWRWSDAFGASLRIEAFIGIGVLLLASLLSATPIPQPEFTDADAAAMTQTQQVDDLLVTLTLSPGAPGVNTFDVTLQRGTTPLADALVTLQLVAPDRDFRTRWLPVEAVESGLYVTVEADLDRVGRWWTLINITENGSTTTLPVRAFFEWEITNDAALQLQRPPSLILLTALLLVLGAAGYLLNPAFQRIVRRLDLQPRAIFVAVGVVVLTLVFMGFGAWMVNEQMRQTEATLHPLPAIVNAVAPDAASLARGEAIYNDACAAWETAPDFAILLRSLDTLRDEALYMIPTQGWRDVPACAGTLSDTERWDVVNYLRARPSGGQ